MRPNAPEPNISRCRAGPKKEPATRLLSTFERACGAIIWRLGDSIQSVRSSIDARRAHPKPANLKRTPRTLDQRDDSLLLKLARNSSGVTGGITGELQQKGI